MKRAAALLSSLLVLGLGADARAKCTPTHDQVFVLGSSLSWDGIPAGLDNNPVWHIFCGAPLSYVLANPYGHCNPTSTPWPGLLDPPGESYDYVTFQPVPDGVSTQQGDIDAIDYWLASQPTCTTAVIHTNWAAAPNWEMYLHAGPNPDFTLTDFSIEYFYDLKEKVEASNPGRTFVLTRGNEMLDHIYHDPNAPLDFDDLFRDGFHMSYGPGRYLQHNAFRQALRQPTGVDSTLPGVDPALRSYLDEVVALYPPYPKEVSAVGGRALGLLAAGLAGVGAGSLVRRWNLSRARQPKPNAG